MPKPLIAKQLTWIRWNAMTVACETQNCSPTHVQMYSWDGYRKCCDRWLQKKIYVCTDIVNTFPVDRETCEIVGFKPKSLAVRGLKVMRRRKKRLRRRTDDDGSICHVLRKGRWLWDARNVVFPLEVRKLCDEEKKDAYTHGHERWWKCLASRYKKNDTSTRPVRFCKWKRLARSRWYCLQYNSCRLLFAYASLCG